jgi:hypothetical protein
VRPLVEKIRTNVLQPKMHQARAMGRVRISAVTDACFRLIVDGESVRPWRRWGSAQELF